MRADLCLMQFQYLIQRFARRSGVTYGASISTKVARMTLSHEFSFVLPRLALDLGALAILLGVFFRNHHRPDLVSVYFACNIGLFSVLTVLSFSPLSSAVGFALFGVLSIIRLRSFEFEHHEIAYFFISLAVALLSAIDPKSLALPATLNLVLVIGMLLVDSRRVRLSSQSSLIVLDSVMTNPKAVREHLEFLLNAQVLNFSVKSVNTIQETTTISVVYRSH